MMGRKLERIEKIGISFWEGLGRVVFESDPKHSTYVFPLFYFLLF